MAVLGILTGFGLVPLLLTWVGTHQIIRALGPDGPKAPFLIWGAAFGFVIGGVFGALFAYLPITAIGGAIVGLGCGRLAWLEANRRSPSDKFVSEWLAS
jgi:hypothetical protein